MSPELLLQFALLGVLLPAVVTGVVFLALRTVLPERAAALGITAGFIAGFFGISGLGGYAFPPRTVQQWLPHAALVALGLGVLEPRWFGNLFARWGVRLVLINLLLWRLFQPFINHPFPARRWTTLQTLGNLTLISVTLVLFWWALDYLLSRRRELTPNRADAPVATALTVMVAGSAIGVVLAHSLIMGLLTGALTATLGAVAVVIWLFRGRLGVSASPLIAVLVALPWLSLYNTLPKPAVLVLALTPWLLVVPLERFPLWQRTLYQVGLVAVPTVLMLFLTFRLS